MMKDIQAVIFSIVVIMFCASCASLEDARIRQGRVAENDFQRLQMLFRKEGGTLIMPNDSLVRWKDTRFSRLYELSEYSVLVYPLDWNDDRYDIVVFSGHLDAYDDIVRDIQPSSRTCERSHSMYTINTTISLSTNIAVRDYVGLRGFFLGQNITDTQVVVDKLNVNSVTNIDMRVYIHRMPFDRVQEQGHEYELIKDVECYRCNTNNPRLSAGPDYVGIRYLGGKAYWVRFMSNQEDIGFDGEVELCENKALPRGVVSEGAFRLGNIKKRCRQAATRATQP